VPFDQNFEGHTFKEFKEISVRREKEDSDIDWSDDSQIYERIEK